MFILTAQSDLPAVSVQAAEQMLEKAFAKRGFEHYSDHFTVKGILGAGTIGITVDTEYKETPSAKEREIVCKFVRPGTLEKIIKGYNNLSRV